MLGNAKADAHTPPSRSQSKLENGFVIQRHKSFRVASRIDRTGKGHLRKEDEITASGYGNEHDLEVGRKVPGQITFLALKCSQ